MATITGTSASDTIDPTFVSETVTGGPVTDLGDNINGLAGNDAIRGGAGNDTIDGGEGSDTINGGAGDDTLTAGQSNSSDQLYGDAGNDQLRGRSPTAGASNQLVLLNGGAGNDTLNGYDQTYNYADYIDETVGVSANLLTGVVTTGGYTDTLTGVLSIFGSNYSDRITGNSNRNTIAPGLGNDTVAGGGGSDTLSYLNISSGVTANLKTGSVLKAGGQADSISGFIDIHGSNFNDTLVGDDQGNYIVGLGGADVIDGGAGYDILGYITTSTYYLTAATAGVTANLTTGVAADGYGSSDSFSNMEALYGSNLADDLTGIVLSDGSRSNLRGYQGADTLRATAVDTRITADYRADFAAVYVNLGAVDAVMNGFTIAASTARDAWGSMDTLVLIQSVRGSAFDDQMQAGDRLTRLDGEGGNDRLVGGAGRVSLFGGDGNDTLSGSDGGDTLAGGAGVDAYRGGGGYDMINFGLDGTIARGVVASLVTGDISDPFGNAETIGAVNDIEMLIGTNLNDDLQGKYIGPSQVSLLQGGQGNDTLRGVDAAAIVAADYSSDADSDGDGYGVDVNLQSQRGRDGWGGIDTLINITGFVGSAFADRMVGDDNDNWFRGQAGNDTMDGGAGRDIAVYSNSAAGVVVDLATGVVRDGFGQTDSLTGIENVDGSGFDDVLNGDAGANLLGGGAGNDTLTGGAGNDQLNGSVGTDTAVFSGALSQARIGQRDGRFIVSDAAGVDELSGIELLKFADAAAVSIASLFTTGVIEENVLLNSGGKMTYLLPGIYVGPVAGLRYEVQGSSDGDVGFGTYSNDFFNLLGGDDALDAGAGNDVLDGGTGSNFLTGGAGIDTFFVDGRGGATTWSTITDWEKGEQLSIWGWRPGISQVIWLDDDGAAGYRGVTMHADLDGSGIIDTSVTWSGRGKAELPTPYEYTDPALLWFT